LAPRFECEESERANSLIIENRLEWSARTSACRSDQNSSLAVAVAAPSAQFEWPPGGSPHGRPGARTRFRRSCRARPLSVRESACRSTGIPQSYTTRSGLARSRGDRIRARRSITCRLRSV